MDISNQFSENYHKDAVLKFKKVKFIEDFGVMTDQEEEIWSDDSELEKMDNKWDHKF